MTTAPEGYRLLHAGEWIRPKTDIYFSGTRWIPLAETDFGMYHPATRLPVARPIDPEIAAMIGGTVFFNGMRLARIVRARETKIGEWVFDMENGHCIRDIRGCSGWEVTHE